MRIVVIWGRFGPYHLARLRGAAKAATEREACITGLEIARSDGVYEWDAATGDGEFDRVTLFPDGNYHALSPRAIKTAVSQALNNMRPNVVLANGWATAEARSAIAWCRNNQASIILMSESKADDQPRVWWKEMIKSRIIKQGDAALVGGQAHADYLQQLGFPADKIFFGYDVVDNDYFRERTAEARKNCERIRRQLDLPERYFFSCTRLLPRKNVDGLLRAYAAYRLEHSHNPWSLVIAGSGEEEDALRRIERDLGVAGVTWPGFIQYDRLPDYYGLASAFIHPAKAEAWGLVVNEALASGLPVLVSKTVGACRELVKGGCNGVTFDPFSETDLKRAMALISSLSDKERSAMGNEALEMASHWSPAKFGAGIMDAVDAALGSRLARDGPAVPTQQQFG